MNMKRKPTTDAIEIMHRLFYEEHPDRLTDLEVVQANDRIALELCELREKAGLSQKQLADKVGTTPEIVDRIELNDFEEFSVEFMQQYARALGKRLEVRIVESEVIAQQAEAKDQPAA